MGFRLQSLSDFDANAYSYSSPLLTTQLCQSVDDRRHLASCQELLILTDDQDSDRIVAGMILPTNDGLSPLAEWPIAESWEATNKILTAYQEWVRKNHTGGSLLLRRSSGDARTEQQCGLFRFLTTIVTYSDHLPEDREPSWQQFQAGESLKLAPVPCDDSVTLDLLEEIGRDSQDCPELLSMMDWETRLADYRQSENVSAIQVRQLLHDDEPIGVAVWTELPSRNQVELKYFGIVPGKRHQGLGTHFLKMVLGEFRESTSNGAFLHVDSRNDFAVKLYENCGFKETDRRELWVAS